MKFTESITAKCIFNSWTESLSFKWFQSRKGEMLAVDMKAAKENWAIPVVRPGQRSKTADSILPIPGEKNYLVSSALPYVNNFPHLGNIIGCVLPADVFTRYCRLRQRNVLFISGTDEYGTATETKAMSEGLTPLQLCDKFHKHHAEIYRWFNISFDYFGRTTNQEQTSICQDIFKKLHENGYVKEMSLPQCFCSNCQKFISDRFVEGNCPNCDYIDAKGDQCDKCFFLINSAELKNPRCKFCGSSNIALHSSPQIYLDLPALVEKENLINWLEGESDAWTHRARGFAQSWIRKREGLREVYCVSRDLKWGTPVPMKKYELDKVFYVWFDAPIGYISITANYSEKNWRQWWLNTNSDVEIDYYQFMAKDNIPFHAVLFPATLLGTKQPWTLATHIVSSEYLNYEDYGRFCKSRGYGVFGNDAMTAGIPADIWRFYLLYIRPETEDSAFCWDDFMTITNRELFNNLGSFINRFLSFLEKVFESTIPEMEPTEDDYYMLAQINQHISQYARFQDNCQMKDALREILNISKIGSQYLQVFQKSLTLDTNETNAGLHRCRTVCGLSAQIIFLIAILLEPFMPDVSKEICLQLNVPLSSLIFSLYVQPFVPVGHKIGQVKPLFKKLEPELIDALREKHWGPQYTAGK